MIVSLILALAVAIPAQPPKTLEPTPLEAFVAEPGARLKWTKFAGRLDGRVASAIVTAIVVEAPTEPKIMRGVRVELRHEGLRGDRNLIMVEWAVLCGRDNAALYIEESRLPEVRAAVLDGAASIHRGHGAGIVRFGTNGVWSGMLIGGYTFNDKQPADVVAMLDAASALLKDAPR